MRKDIEAAALAAGLRVDTHSPGDGVTRYRFFADRPHPLVTVSGTGLALIFIDGYGAGRALNQPTYSLAEIRNGTGWPKGARFAVVTP